MSIKTETKSRIVQFNVLSCLLNVAVFVCCFSGGVREEFQVQLRRKHGNHISNSAGLRQVRHEPKTDCDSVQNNVGQVTVVVVTVNTRVYNNLQHHL